MSIVAGVHVPLIPFGEVEFNVGGVVPEQTKIVLSKLGVMLFAIVISIVKGAYIIQGLACGVNVYVVVPTIEVLIVEGLHVPFIGVLFDDEVGSKEEIAFKQYEVVIVGKVIVLLVCGFTVTVIVCGVPAQPLITGVTL